MDFKEDYIYKDIKQSIRRLDLRVLLGCNIVDGNALEESVASSTLLFRR
jgi:hypothetical protein